VTQQKLIVEQFAPDLLQFNDCMTSKLQFNDCMTPEQWTGCCAVWVSYRQTNCHCKN